MYLQIKNSDKYITRSQVSPKDQQKGSKATAHPKSKGEVPDDEG